MKIFATTVGGIVLLCMGAIAGCGFSASSGHRSGTRPPLECKIDGPPCVQTAVVTTSSFFGWNKCKLSYDYQFTKVPPGRDVYWVLPAASNGVGRLTFDGSGVVIGKKVDGVMTSVPSPDFINGRLATTSTTNDTFAWTASPAGSTGEKWDYAFQALWIKDEASSDQPITCTPKVDPVIVNSL